MEKLLIGSVNYITKEGESRTEYVYITDVNSVNIVKVELIEGDTFPLRYTYNLDRSVVTTMDLMHYIVLNRFSEVHVSSTQYLCIKKDLMDLTDVECFEWHLRIKHKMSEAHLPNYEDGQVISGKEAIIYLYELSKIDFEELEIPGYCKNFMEVDFIVNGNNLISDKNIRIDLGDGLLLKCNHVLESFLKALRCYVRPSDYVKFDRSIVKIIETI